jgi:hypothetical protein
MGDDSIDTVTPILIWDILSPWCTALPGPVGYVQSVQDFLHRAGETLRGLAVATQVEFATN